jgi:hypothetical protein
VNKIFTVDGHAAKVYDVNSKKSYDYVTLKASYSPDPKVKLAFVFEFHDDKKP